MKWLYRVLRLVFCPHKYDKLMAHGQLLNNNNEAFGNYYDKECKYCGKIKRFECC